MTRPVRWFLFWLVAITSEMAIAASPYCHGSVRGHSAVFLMENSLGDKPMQWFKGSSAPNTLEYQWSVTPGALRDDGKFQALDASFGFSLFRWEESRPMEGSLQELFAYGQLDLWKDTRSARDSTHSVIPGAKIKIGLFEGNVMIGINDRETFMTVFRDRPPAAKITAYLPAAGKHYSCVTTIEYE